MPSRGAYLKKAPGGRREDTRGVRCRPAARRPAAACRPHGRACRVGASAGGARHPPPHADGAARRRQDPPGPFRGPRCRGPVRRRRGGCRPVPGPRPRSRVARGRQSAGPAGLARRVAHRAPRTRAGRQGAPARGGQLRARARRGTRARRTAAVLPRTAVARHEPGAAQPRRRAGDPGSAAAPPPLRGHRRAGSTRRRPRRRDAGRARPRRPSRLHGDRRRRGCPRRDLPAPRRASAGVGAGRGPDEAVHPRRAGRPAAVSDGRADEQPAGRARPPPHAARRAGVESRAARAGRARAVPPVIDLRRGPGRWPLPSGSAPTRIPISSRRSARCSTRASCSARCAPGTSASSSCSRACASTQRSCWPAATTASRPAIGTRRTSPSARWRRRPRSGRPRRRSGGLPRRPRPRPTSRWRSSMPWRPGTPRRRSGSPPRWAGMPTSAVASTPGEPGCGGCSRQPTSEPTSRRTTPSPPRLSSRACWRGASPSRTRRSACCPGASRSATAAGDLRQTAIASSFLGHLARVAGRPADARAHHELAADLYRQHPEHVRLRVDPPRPGAARAPAGRSRGGGALPP